MKKLTNPNDKGEISKRLPDDVEISIEQTRQATFKFGSALGEAKVFHDALNKIIDGKHTPPEEIQSLRQISRSGARRYESLVETYEDDKTFLNDIKQRFNLPSFDDLPKLTGKEED